MAEPRSTLDGDHELAPSGALRRECLPSRRRQAVIPAAALPRVLDPTARNQTAPFEPIEHRIKRCRVERQDSAGAAVDLLGDVVAMVLPRLELSQDEKLRRPLLPGLVLGWFGCHLS